MAAPMSEFRSAYESCLEACGRIDNPGLALDRPGQIDFSGRETTVDQAAIENAMAEMNLTASTILHVGVGNSSMAARFASRVQMIDGITMSANEKSHADSLAIPNYRVFVVNKYSREFARTISLKYDLIIDNNLASFACCKFHFYTMLDSYVSSLKVNGRILTEQTGMDWVFMNLEPRWKLSFDDLAALKDKFPVRAARVTMTVYSIQRIG
jgi:hypothetical protein